MHTGLLDDLCGAVGIVGIDIHTKALGDAGHVAADVAEGEDAQLLAHELGAALAVVEITDGHDEQTEDELGHGVGVLARRILGHHVVSRGGGEVDVVVAGTGADDDLQLLGSVEHLGVDLVRTDDHGISILDGVKQLSLLSIFLEQHELMAGCLHFCFDTIHSSGCKRFLCCY